MNTTFNNTKNCVVYVSIKDKFLPIKRKTFTASSIEEVKKQCERYIKQKNYVRMTILECGTAEIILNHHRGAWTTEIC